MSILQPYIFRGMLSIDALRWSMINHLYDKDTIIKAFKDEILNGNISLPLREITESDAINSFCDLLNYKGFDFKHGTLHTRYHYDFDVVQDGEYIEGSNIGNVASDYFQQENRFYCDSINAPSPARTWGSSKFLDSMLKSLWTLKVKEVNSSTLRTSLSLRKYIASQFKPSVAKSIYEKFKSVDVLDFSAGWGDRLCGFYACKNTKSYIGIDPNERVYKKYFEQVGLYSRLTQEKHTEFICMPAEDVVLQDEIVDTVFTSPPYFNIERYSNDSTQSYKRYRKLEDWLNCFLFKAIDLSVKALKQGGYLIINISDVYSGHQINKICDPMNFYLKSKGMKYYGMIGMKMAKRPNSKADGVGVFIEPIWIWQK